jgi:hypothetical protein
MSKSYRSGADATAQKKPSSTSSTGTSAKTGLPNSLVKALIETAIVQTGEETSYLEMAATDLEETKTTTEPVERRQQTAPLPDIRPDHADSNEYADYDKGVAFLKGSDDEHAIDPDDVAQGSLGDCYLMAAMVAVARADPDAIQELIKDNEDGTFDVNLHIRDSWRGSPKEKTHTVDTRLPEKYEGTPLYAKLGDETPEAQEMWPALLEKALAQEKGGFEEIRGSKIAQKGFKYAGALELLTGKGDTSKATVDMDEDEVMLKIQKALADKKPVVVGSYNMKDDPEKADEAKKYNVYGNHAYAPSSVDLENRTISLTNPWGKRHVEAIPVADFMKYYSKVRVGD